MTENEDKIVGRVKQAAGDLTGDEELKEEGETQETAGKAKEIVDSTAAKAHAAIDWLHARIRRRR